LVHIFYPGKRGREKEKGEGRTPALFSSTQGETKRGGNGRFCQTSLKGGGGKKKKNNVIKREKSVHISKQEEKKAALDELEKGRKKKKVERRGRMPSIEGGEKLFPLGDGRGGRKNSGGGGRHGAYHHRRRRKRRPRREIVGHAYEKKGGPCRQYLFPLIAGGGEGNSEAKMRSSSILIKRKRESRVCNFPSKKGREEKDTRKKVLLLVIPQGRGVGGGGWGGIGPRLSSRSPRVGKRASGEEESFPILCEEEENASLILPDEKQVQKKKEGRVFSLVEE